jgi:hypothetical protein
MYELSSKYLHNCASFFTEAVLDRSNRFLENIQTRTPTGPVLMSALSLSSHLVMRRPWSRAISPGTHEIRSDFPGPQYPLPMTIRFQYARIVFPAYSLPVICGSVLLSASDGCLCRRQTNSSCVVNLSDSTGRYEIDPATNMAWFAATNVPDLAGLNSTPVSNVASSYTFHMAAHTTYSFYLDQIFCGFATAADDVSTTTR